MEPGNLDSPGRVKDGLRQQGYIASDEVATVLYLAPQLGQAGRAGAESPAQ